MNEIVAVNAQIRAEVGERFAGDSPLVVERNSTDPPLETLPTSVRERVLEIGQLISGLLPGDFGFTLLLGAEEPGLSMTYEDGPMTQFRTGIEVAKWLSVADQFGEIDWNAIRQMALSGAAVFNHIVEHSPEAPENAPLTERLQAKFQTETEAFHAGTNDPDRVHALVWDDYQGLQQETFKAVDDFERQLPDMMTCGYHVVCVVADGKALAAKGSIA